MTLYVKKIQLALVCRISRNLLHEIIKEILKKKRKGRMFFRSEWQQHFHYEKENVCGRKVKTQLYLIAGGPLRSKWVRRKWWRPYVREAHKICNFLQEGTIVWDYNRQLCEKASLGSVDRMNLSIVGITRNKRKWVIV